MKNKLFSNFGNKKSKPVQNVVPDGPAEFETAVSALGFGKFNFILMLIVVPSQLTIMTETSIMSYISPVAQCDLNLTLSDKGLLNAITYVGSIGGAVFWGFLIDTAGRKKLLSIGYLIEAIVVLITAFCQNFTFLVIMKCIGGATVGGLYIALCTYISEFHSIMYRGKIQMAMGFAAGGGLVLIPLVGAFFLPLDFNVSLFNGYMRFHAWNLFIAISSVMPFAAGMAFLFLPESPKFLMSKGNNEEALSILKKVYSINSGQPEEKYPIAKLIRETVEKSPSATENTGCIEYLKRGWNQMAPLFGKEYFPKLILVTIIQTLNITCANTLRGWLPQIYQSIHEYQTENNGSTANLCVMIEGIKTADNLDPSEVICNVNLEDNFSVYLNSMINAFVCMGGYLITGTLINILGRKTLLVILGVSAGVTITMTYFSENMATTITLTSLNLATASVGFDVALTIIVVIFPTTLRAMAISFTLLIGRAGAILGNMAFPLLLQLGCAGPFSALAGLMFVFTILCFLLPNTDKDPLR